ncbi:MAG: hypothetical protein ACYCTW_11650 [Sulfuricella sp.]
MARRIFLLMIAFLSGHAACAGAEPLGRLFFSPDERAMLDRMRNNTSRSVAASTEQITLNGLVRRSSGKTTAWINQVPQNENETTQGIAVRQGKTSKPSAVLLLPSGKKVRLKAGQTFDTAKGKVREGYEDATTTPPPEAAK